MLNLFGDNKLSRNLSSNYQKKRIILLVDLYDWCFYNIASRIKKQLTEYTIDILMIKEFYNNIRNVLANPYHIYVFFYPSTGFKTNEIMHLKNVGKYKFNSPSKVFWCMYDNFTWRIPTDYHPGRAEMIKNTMARWMNACDGYFWASPKIRDNMYESFKIIKPNASCMDGVDIEIFKYKKYDEDILTKKKLKIGWIGNSDAKQSGVQKGFKEIKQYVNDLSNNFEFCPLDRQIKLIPHEEVPNYIHGIDIIVCYSTCEGTPNQILEGSSCGRCWISTDVGIVSSLYNTIENNPTGIIIKKNEKAFKDALMNLYNNRKIIREYGKNGRKAIEKKWSWENRLEGFKRIFEQF
tara:strand:+ start:603 stop:1652 length:1050 start_codon:yes stop_codon:yes gene_type:complete